jgi:hexosaminidase
MSERMPEIVPVPQTIEPRTGCFVLEDTTKVAGVGTPEARKLGGLLADYLRPATGFPLPAGEAGSAEIVLEQTGRDRPDDAGFVEEEYELVVEPEEVRLTSSTSKGLARGIQTFRQILPPQILSPSRQQDVDWVIPCVRIADEPRFRWRGLHLDVCRHFFTVREVCRYIDLLALHRFNVLHWHLTEDQGWRVEIERYPKLTEIGSKRPYTLIGHERERPRRYDDEPYGGFYSQNEIRQVVDYAAARGVTIVPEIDMPGHMQAAVSAYPELGNTDMTLQPRCHWGISQHILNPRQSTVEFMQGVLEEILSLFPGRFIHVGGDEAVKVEWSESRSAQERMLELGLSSEAEMQSWFIRQMDAFLEERGRRLIGWDEILEGGLAPGAAVMSWRGEEGGIEAARAGHDVVMAPGQCTYFDHYQAEPTEDEPLAIGGLTTLDEVYAYEPVPEELSEEQAQHVLGSQGQLWTEYIPDMQKLEYMAYPRACALAEVVWTRPGHRDPADFSSRMEKHSERLGALQVNAGPISG